jgi:uncharacterized protein involved in exopolysaccharide biosynthesis
MTTETGPNPLLSASRRTAAFLWSALAAWRLGLAVLVVGLAAAFAAPKAIEPRYKSESLLANRESIRAGDEERNDNKRFGAKLKEMLLARSKLEEIVKELKLYPGTDDPIAAVDKLRTDIQFKANEDTFLIGYEASDPQLAALVVSRLAEGVVEESSRLRRERATASKDFLEEQKQRAEQDLKTAERRLADFVRQHPEYASDVASQRRATTTAAATAAGSRYNAGDAQRSALERQAARLRERLEAEPNAAGASAAQQRLDGEIAAAKKDADEKSARYTDQHPDVVAANRRLAELKAERAEMQRQVADLSESDKGNIRSELARLNALIGRVKGSAPVAGGGAGAGTPVTVSPTNNEADAIVKVETEWARLQRDQVEARERSKLLEERLFKATIALNVEELGGATQLAVVDRAYVPVAPLKNSKPRVLAVGILVAVLLALLSMLVSAYFDSTIRSASQIAALSLTPMVLSISMPQRSLPKTHGRRG